MAPFPSESAGDPEGRRRSVKWGSPFGTEAWVRETAERLGLQGTLIPRAPPAEGGHQTCGRCHHRP